MFTINKTYNMSMITDLRSLIILWSFRSVTREVPRYFGTLLLIRPVFFFITSLTPKFLLKQDDKLLLLHNMKYFIFTQLTTFLNSVGLLCWGKKKLLCFLNQSLELSPTPPPSLKILGSYPAGLGRTVFGYRDSYNNNLYSS